MPHPAAALVPPTLKTKGRARARFFVFLIVLLAAFSGTAADNLCYGASRKPLKAKHAMVVSAHELASNTGVAILRQGGNAVDAAVAVGFALAVVFPEAGNIGGGGFMVIRNAGEGKSEVIDFRETAPGAATRSMYLDSAGGAGTGSIDGHLSSGVPGTVAGLLAALERHGTMEIRDVLQPAIDLAEQGFILNERGAAMFQEYRDLLLQYPSTVAAFTRNGELYQDGDTLRQPELASTLRRIQKDGADGFYGGETARLIIAEMERGGGIITLEDLARYEVAIRAPLTSTYRGYEVITAPPPSSGGLCLIGLLQIMEGFDLGAMGFHSSRSVHVIAEAMKRAFADRAVLMGDPDFVTVPTDLLTSRAYAETRRREIDTVRASTSAEVQSGTGEFLEGVHTTHFSVVDERGNAVSTTYTLNDLFGSKVVVGGAGFFLNDEMDDFVMKPGMPNTYGLIGGEANAIQPYKRPLSSMSPTILVKDGAPVLVMGARGGPKIISAVFQTILNVIDYGMGVQQAVDQPRFHHQWYPDELVFERFCVPEDVLANLRARGHVVRESDSSVGQLEVIFIDPRTGWIYGAPDPREGGVAAGY